MGQRIRAVAVAVVLLAVGALGGSALSQWWGGGGTAGEAAARASEEEAGARAPAERVRVEVLNGGGRRDMARHATEHLRDLGFDVVYFGNADTFDHDSTVVLDRVGRRDLAEAVALALGRTAAAVREGADTTRFVDVSVVLGASWDPPAAAPGRVEPAGQPAWWDLRRFLPERGEVPAGEGAAGRMADPANGGG